MGYRTLRCFKGCVTYDACKDTIKPNMSSKHWTDLWSDTETKGNEACTRLN